MKHLWNVPGTKMICFFLVCSCFFFWLAFRWNTTPREFLFWFYFSTFFFFIAWFLFPHVKGKSRAILLFCGVFLNWILYQIASPWIVFSFLLLYSVFSVLGIFLFFRTIFSE